MTDTTKPNTPEEGEKQGIFLYTDGAANPTNPGNVGFAVHGCLYEYTTPKKGSGNPDVVVTNHGYISKVNKQDLNVYAYEDREVVEVTPVAYIDICGSQIEKGTNQYSELTSMNLAMSKACEFPLRTATFITDSEYVRIGVTEHLPNWADRNWLKRDGEPIMYVDIWKEIHKHYNTLKLRGVQVFIDRVPGHGDGQNNSYGNLIADTIAVIGSRRSAMGVQQIEMTTADPSGYWKQEVDKHPMIYNRRMYFNTLPDSQIKGEYYFGEHGTDDELLGKRLRDGVYSVVQLKEACDILEYVRKIQTEISKGADSIVLARVDALFTPEIYSNVMEYGPAYLEKTRDNFRNELSTIKKVPITKDLNPPLISMRAIDSLSILKTVLQQYRDNKTEGYVLNDITDKIYDKVVSEKKGKETVTYSIKKHMAETAEFPLPVKATTDNGDVELEIKLTLGLDMPNRNTLKKLEGPHTKVIVITWSEAPDSFKYATIIESEGNYGIWAAFYSNTIFVPIDYWAKKEAK